jgi:hypothetical protein
MRIYTSILSQLLALTARQEDDKSPHRGSGRREFFQSLEILAPHQVLKTLTRASARGAYSCVMLLGLMTILPSVDAQFTTYGATAQPESATASQLLSAKTQHGQDPPPPSGSGLRPLAKFQAISNS